MQAGRLRERVAIQRNTPVQNVTGQPIPSWATFATVWASVLGKASGERFISGAEQVQAEISHTVRIRYRTDVTVQMRLLWESRILEVENVVDPDGRTSDLILMCREVQV